MSQELTKVAPAPIALGATEQRIAEFQEAFAANVSDGMISVFEMDRIKVMSGASLWLVPKPGGEETAAKIEGVILSSRDIRAYYKSKDAGNVPPDCASSDCITGVGNPGGVCAKCPLAEWESADGDSSAQACKQARLLFFLHGESMLPDIVSLPPTSVKPSKQYFFRLLKDAIPKYGAITAIELEKAQSKAGKAYGRAKFTFVRRLTADEQARAMTWSAMMDELLKKPTPEK